MKIELINYTPDPEGTITKATRTCYQSFDKQAEASDKKLLAHIVRHDESPLEFANFTFLIDGISRVTSHQLVRHRMASYAQKSQRYCSEENFAYIIPPSIEQNPEAQEIFLKLMRESQSAYDKLKSLGIKNEDARYLLPNACSTQIICNFNARSLRHFLKLRLSPRSQWEIRDMATKMKELIHSVAPTLTLEL